MNIRRLEYFLTLARTGNVGRAAEMLSVSPPALSKAMKVLESETGIKLWRRDGRKITLTDSGKQLLKKAPTLVEDLKGLIESLDPRTPASRAVRIGTFEVFSTYFLRFLDQQGWNQERLELHELLPGELEKYLLAGEFDYGITYMPAPNPELDFLKVASIEMGVFTKAGAFKNVPQQELPFVVPIAPLGLIPTKIRGLDGWPESAYRRKVLHRVTLLESALELCRQGRAAGYFPVFIAEEHNSRVRSEYRLERRKTPYSGRTCRADVFLVKRKSDEESHVAKQLAKAIRMICA